MIEWHDTYIDYPPSQVFDQEPLDMFGSETVEFVVCSAKVIKQQWCDRGCICGELSRGSLLTAIVTELCGGGEDMIQCCKVRRFAVQSGIICQLSRLSKEEVDREGTVCRRSEKTSIRSHLQ